jgi:hypothetical protein
VRYCFGKKPPLQDERTLQLLTYMRLECGACDAEFIVYHYPLVDDQGLVVDLRSQGMQMAASGSPKNSTHFSR